MLIKVKAFPNSKRGEIVKKSKHSYEVKLKEKPIKGRANKALVEILSLYFKTPKVNIRLIKGFKERNKILEIK